MHGVKALLALALLVSGCGDERVELPSWQKLASDQGRDGDSFGASLAMSVDTLVVGAPETSVGTNPYQGVVHVFQRGSGGWVEKQPPLFAVDGEAADRFGAAVSVAGELIVIGAPFHRVGPNPSQGAVYVYAWDGETWAPRGGPLSSADGAPGDGFGTAVATNGVELLVGAPAHDEPNLADAGAAYVFGQQGSEYVQMGPTLRASDAGAGEAFGAHVAMSEDTALVGAPIHPVGPNVYQGTVYPFVRQGDEWRQQGEGLKAPDGGAFDQLGPCAISGDRALVGAPYHVEKDRGGVGAAYLFERRDEVWRPIGARWTSPTREPGETFGAAVALDGERAVVLAAGEPTLAGEGRGAVHRFRLEDGEWTSGEPPIVQPSRGAAEALGPALSLAGEWIAVGAPLAASGGESSGVAWVFPN